VEIQVKARHTEVSDRLRQHVTDKLAKLERFEHKVTRLDVEICAERNPRQSDHRERVELTCHAKGPVIRAEASAQDVYAALDIAAARLEARLRRAADRRRVHHGSRTPTSVATATAGLADMPDTDAGEADGEEGDSEAEPAADGSPNGHRGELHQAGVRNLAVAGDPPRRTGEGPPGHADDPRAGRFRDGAGRSRFSTSSWTPKAAFRAWPTAGGASTTG